MTRLLYPPPDPWHLRSIRVIVRIFCLITAFAPAHAQEEGRTVAFRLLQFDTARPARAVFLQDPNPKATAPAAPINLKSYLNHEAAVMPLTENRITVTGSADRASLTKPQEILASIDVPAGLNQVLLLALPGRPGAAGELRLLALDDSVKGFPRGSLKILNLSPFSMRLTLEEKTFEFQSGQSHLVADPPVGENNHSAMRALAMMENEWKRVASGSWPHPGQKRSLQIIFENPVSRQPELRGFRDVAVRDTMPSPPPPAGGEP